MKKVVSETNDVRNMVYNQLPISQTRKGPGKVSDLARCPTYP